MDRIASRAVLQCEARSTRMPAKTDGAGCARSCEPQERRAGPPQSGPAVGRASAAPEGYLATTSGLCVTTMCPWLLLSGYPYRKVIGVAVLNISWSACA